MKITPFFFGVFVLLSCSSQSDGFYCADVDYYNSNTSQQSNYTLIARVSERKLKQLDFPSGGHIDEEDFGMVSFDSKGETIVRLQTKTYKVKLIKKGTDCFSKVPRAKRCKGTTANGNRCENKTDNQSGYCWQHS